MQNNIEIEYFKTPFGELILGSFKQQLCLADWRYRKMRDSIDHRIKVGLSATFTDGSSKLIEETKTQLSQYFRGERTEFDIPILLVGTDFQKKAWNELIKIPYGTTDTYSYKINFE